MFTMFAVVGPFAVAYPRPLRCGAAAGDAWRTRGGQGSATLKEPGLNARVPGPKQAKSYIERDFCPRAVQRLTKRSVRVALMSVLGGKRTFGTPCLQLGFHLEASG